MEELLEDAAPRSARYLAEIQERAVAPSAEAVAASGRLREPFPAGPSEPADVLALLDEIGSPATMGIAGPRFFGFVIGGVAAGRPGRELARDGLGPERRLRLGRPRPPSVLEEVALEWMLDVLGLPRAVRARSSPAPRWRTSPRSPPPGTRCSRARLGRRGRRAVRRAADHGRDRRGGAPDAVQGARPPRASAATGWCACPSTARGACAPRRCRRSRPATIVCAQAGNVNTGAFDPLAAIAARTREAGAWVHVDGAFGLWAAAARASGAPASPASALADSWATDAHKWLNVPTTAASRSCATPRRCARRWRSRPTTCRRRAGVRNPSDFTPELSRRARGVEVWAALRSLGRSGLADLIERNCRHAARFAEGLAAAGYEILNDVVLNQVLVSFGEPAETRARHRRHPGRRHLLVRRHGLAGADRDAHQRVVLGDDGRGRRAQPRGDPADRRGPVES